MLNKKIKSLIERTKVLFKERKKEICLGALGVVLLGTIGFAVAGLSNTDSKEVASNNKTSITEKAENNKKEDKNKTDKKEENKKEDSTKEETKVDADKKEESTSEGTETSSKEESKSESSNTGSSSNGGSSSSNNEVANKPSNGGGSSSLGSGSSNGGGNSNTPNPPAHSHSWNPVTDTVWHDEVGHYETVVIKDAWTEEVPIYEEREVAICNGCGADITSNIDKHMTDNILAGNMACTGWHTDWKQVQVGTDKINHPAVTEDRWVVDKAAWSETVTTGYKCSCGATK